MKLSVTAILVLVFVFVVFYKLLEVLFLSDKKKSRLADLIDSDQGIANLEQEFGNDQVTGVASMMENVVGQFKDLDKEKSALKLKLLRAGWQSPNAAAYYLFFQTFGIVVGLAVFGIIYLYGKAITPPGGSLNMIYAVGAILGAMGVFGARLALSNAIEKRAKILTMSFPDALDLMLVCVESGLALDASLARVCKELKYAHPEMTRELNKTRLELTMLNDRERALNNLILRTNLVPIRSLVAALQQSEKYGTSLMDTLRVLSDDYRQTRMMKAEEKAGKLATKITIVTIPPMLIALLIMITAPAVIKLSNTWH